MKIFVLSTLIIITFSHTPAICWDKWSNRGIGESMTGYIETIESITDKYGRMRIFAVKIDDNRHIGTFRHKRQLQENSNKWTKWWPMGAPEGLVIDFNSDFSVIKDAKGRYEIYVRCNDGNIYFKREGEEHISWGKWHKFGTYDETAPSTDNNFGVYADRSHDRRAVAVIDTKGKFWFKLSDPISAKWFCLGKPIETKLTAKPMIGQYTSDGRVYLPRCFAIGEDGNLWIHDGDNWKSLGGPSNIKISTSLDPIIATDKDRRLEIFVVGEDNQFWKIYQIPETFHWSDWVKLPSRGTNYYYAIFGAEVTKNKDGRLELFYLQAISKKSLGPISLLEAKFKSSEYYSMPPV